MSRSIPFSDQERKVIGEHVGFFGMVSPVYNTPLNPRENVQALYFDKKPYWQVNGRADVEFLIPDLYNDKLGRSPNNTDTFNRFWEFHEIAQGSITRGGNPLFEDVNEWKDHIVIPDVDEWDWEKCAEDTKMDTRYSPIVSLVNGYGFERMISFMDFIPAAMALVDEDQHDAIIEMLGALTDLAIKVIDKLCEYYPCLDGINIHDDWGSQQAPFFSEEIARKLFVPFLKQMTDHIHSKGRYVSLHSCGHNEDRIQLFIDAGFDEWQPQTMNNTAKLYEEYGDQIIIGVYPDDVGPDATDDDYRQAARDYVDRFCLPGKPSLLGMNDVAMNPVFSAELYEYSRKHYAKLYAE